MSLSCNCDIDYYDFEPGDWIYQFEHHTWFVPLDTPKRKRCASCGELIDIGAQCIKYPRVRYPYSEVEAKITGIAGFPHWEEFNDEPNIPMADHYHCEKCGEIFLNLSEIGYCIPPGEDMNKLLREYHDLTGFEPAKADG